MEYLFFIVIAFLIVVPLFLLKALFNARHEQRKMEWHASLKFTTLRIDVPKNNDKQPLAAEQMFASMHGIYSGSAYHQHHLSFEVVAKDKFIQFYVTCPTHLKDFIEGQIYAQYPTVEIHEVEDYAKELKAHDLNFAVCELEMNKPDVYPIKFFDSFEVDPLSGITSVMSKLAAGEEVWFQLIMKPVGDEWQEKGNNIVSAVRSGKKIGGQALFASITSAFKNFLRILVVNAINPGAELTPTSVAEVKLPSTVEDALKGIEQKITKLGFETKIRILSIANDPVTAGVKCQNVAAAFKQFNTTNLNGFKVGDISKNNFDTWQAFVGREFVDKGNIMNITELASIYHLPNQTVETPSIVWSGFKKGEPPANLPLDENTPAEVLTVIGATNFRNVYRKFGIKIDDRRRHIYIIGKSGTGKSTLIENMAIDDVYEGRGVIIVDPHGELAEKVMSCVPEDRIEDVIVFDPADRAFPIAFNLLETVDDDFKGMVASGFVGIFKKIFGDSWGPRLEHILRNTVLALLDNEKSTMLDIPRMLTDNHFRDKVVQKVKDPVIRDFWVNEFAQYDAKFRTEAVSPILNKVGQFLATATIRNIVGQYRSRINIREIMDQKKILIVNLSRGKIGEDNSALLGAMIITKIQLAAMSRADVSVEKRPDSFLYVDEFQNFATDSFAVILSEARKYNLCLTMANQYVEQMPESVRSAVFGNAGTLVAFRVGGTDAGFLVKEFEPVFDANDMVNLDKFNIYIKLLIDGMSSPAFSAKTFPPVDKVTNNTEKIVQYTHDHYAASRADVEEEIQNRDKEDEEEMRREAEAFRQGGLEALLVKKNGNGGVDNHQNNDNTSNSGSTFETDNSVSSGENKNENIKNQNENIEEGDSQNEKEVENQKVEEHSDSKSNADNGEKKDLKPRVFRYQNIIGDKIFKEQTARGGIKWFIGEDIDLEKMKETGVEITDKAMKMIDLAKKVKSKNERNNRTGESENVKNKNEKKTGEQSEKKEHKKEDTKNDSKINDIKIGTKEGGNDKDIELMNESELKEREEPKKEEDGQSGDIIERIGDNSATNEVSDQKPLKAGHLKEGEEVEL